jgi:hypothetical protein
MTAISRPAFATRARYTDDARDVLQLLDRRVDDVLADVRRMPAWRAVTDPATPDADVIAIMREVFRAVTWYQPRTTEAGFHMLGRLPKGEHKLLRSLVQHKAEEAEHGEWARRDYLALGGTAAGLAEPPSAATFAVAGVWWHLAQAEEPFGYIGAEYLFEKLTMFVTQELLEALKGRALGEAGMGFIVEHATEDVKHTNLIAHHALDVATRYPEKSAEAMLRCFDYFRQVYPLPVWSEAADRALGRV